MTGAELITWEQCKAVTEELFNRQETLNDDFVNKLDQSTGIYLITYAGNELGGRIFSTNDTPQVIFVGSCKPESSRHFKCGTTGTSTIRRSLAALLASRLDLVPIPRSSDINDNDRYDNYTLTAEGEEKLTAWMKDNFKVAYYEVPADQVEAMKLALVGYAVPMFNFQHNPENKYGAEIKIARKRLAAEAKKNEADNN